MERSGRVAYAFASSLLPEPAEGMDWRVARSFSAANELLMTQVSRKFSRLRSIEVNLGIGPDVARLIGCTSRDFDAHTTIFIKCIVKAQSPPVPDLTFSADIQLNQRV
jgi:hypothetical protein